MKRLVVSLFVTLFLLVVTFVPVSAGSLGVNDLRFYVEAPNSASQGETVHVIVHAQNVGRKPTLLRDVMIHFPKSLVAAVSMVSVTGTIVDKSTESEFIYKWSMPGILYPSATRDLRLDVVLRTDASIGMSPFVNLLGFRGILLEYRDITVLASVLKVTSNAPDVVSKGGVIFFIELTLTNESSVSLPFDVAATVFHAGTDRSTEYSFTGGDVYDFRGDSVGATLYWHGVVPAGQSFTLTVKTASGRYPGTYDLLGLTDLLHPENLYATRMVIIL